MLSWRISNTLGFCIEALQEALSIYGDPEIFNTDQGCQFTSCDFTSVLEAQHIKISMDGKGRALDNIYIERLWRSLKYENIFLNEYKNLKELKGGISSYFEFYNAERYHPSRGRARILNVGGVMKSFFCDHKKKLFEHRLTIKSGCMADMWTATELLIVRRRMKYRYTPVTG